ncbi:MAG: hypothetical protein LLG20_18815 [Acidobacteriales bacterium]|nr:hypothetical protein [Terriglobales bacterium]
MTIALGVLASNAVVLAADTEQSWSHLKTSESKLFTAEDSNGSIAITGAGVSGYLKSLSQKFIAAFKNAPQVSADEMGQILDAELWEFFDRHVTPCAYLNPAPEIYVIIGLERNGERRLWSSAYSTLHPCDRYAAVGAGGEYAESLLRQLLAPPKCDPQKIDHHIAQRIAAYAVFVTKGLVQSCGQSTEVVCVAGGRAEKLGPEIIEILGYHLGEFSDFQTLSARHILGYPVSDEEKAAEKLVKLFRMSRARIAALKNERIETSEWSLESPEEGD